jgi:arylsulfatase A-like enzyme
VVTNPVIGSAKKGFDQGFDVFVVPEPEEPAVGTGRVLRRAETVVKHAAKLLDQIDRRPILLWLHLMDPHGPYSTPEATRAAHADLLAPPDDRRRHESDLRVSATNYGLGVLPRYQAVPGRRHPADLRAAYDMEIRYADSQIGALREQLQRRGLWDEAVVALTADHGESLGEHDYYFQHGWFTYDASLRVPLLIRAPKRLEPRRIAASVSLVDLAATLTELLGLGPADTGEGRSLLPVVRGEEGDRAAFARNSYSNQLSALRLGSRSYIFTPPPNELSRRRDDGWKAHWPSAMREELYDLETDPGETIDLSLERPAQARLLREQLRAWLRDQQHHAAKRERISIDPELASELQALGYLD